MLVCATSLLPIAAATGVDMETLPWEQLEDAAAPLPEIEGAAPAYLLFTSGSTGEPKGAVSLHSAFLRPAREVCRHDIYRPGDRVALAAPLPFMAAIDTMLWALLAGAEICMFSVRERGPVEFGQWMARSGITAWGTAVAAMRGLAAAMASRPLPSLRLVMVGGDVLHREDVTLARAMSQVPLDIMPVYASTEMPLVAWQVITHDDPLDADVPIGLGEAVEGSSLRLEPIEGQPSGTGEIVVDSPVGSLGYWRRPELDAERFRFDDSGTRMSFRTGDIARRTPDGRIEIVGRTDSMVKVRGQQVHLSMVEAALRSDPGVGDAAVLAVGGATDRVLVAHVAGLPDEPPPDARAVRTTMRRNLPAHMVPARIHVHERLPMTSRGKVDRVALESTAVVAPRTAGRLPGTPTERAVLRIWQELLRVDDVGVDEDFFEVGGDSVSAVQLLVALEEQFGLWQPLSTWMDATTVEAIAATIDADRSALRRLTRIQPGSGSRPPLVLAYDLHGGAFRFKRFAAAIGTDQEVWGLDNPLLAGEAGMPTTIAGLAELHVADLTARWGDAPLHLVGYSGSGTYLVVEMVRQLLDAGHPVGFVGLVDFGPVHLRHGGRPRAYRPPGAWPNRPPSDLPLRERLGRAIDEVRSAPPGERSSRLSRLLDVPKAHDMALARVDLARRGRVRPELRTSFMWYRTMDALVDHEPAAVDVAADLFVSDQTAKGNIATNRRVDYGSLTDPLLGWDGIIRGGLTPRPVVGQHNDLIEPPYVDGLGRAVRSAFDEWLERHDVDRR
jgi:enterobactin synthetase component F